MLSTVLNYFDSMPQVNFVCKRSGAPYEIIEYQSALAFISETS